ncbi:MAG: hypothetical protein WC809_05085 [Sinimarinibacterium sp.]|jgi:hypothetical protein
MKDRKQGTLRGVESSERKPKVPVLDAKSKSQLQSNETCTPEAEWQWAQLHRALRDLIRIEDK